MLTLRTLTPQFIYLESSSLNHLYTYDSICKYIIFMANKYEFDIKLSEPKQIIQVEMTCADDMPIECCPVQNSNVLEASKLTLLQAPTHGMGRNKVRVCK